MATGSLLALLDDITTILDDVGVLSKLAAKKTAGVVGDDLALNANQVTGVNADRELPVVWAVAKGSLLNKVILVPAALAISAFAPWAVTPLLMLGGAYLCYEGFEKLVHKFVHADEPAHVPGAPPHPELSEKDKIKGAVRTDFILSAEIIAITLGTVAESSLTVQLAVMSAIALAMTVGVYGLVAGIVKLDDAGLALSRRTNALARGLGRAILAAAPWLMRVLSVAGTAAMFLVGGGIVVHGIAPLHHWVEAHAQGVLEMLANAAVGVAVGALALAGVFVAARVRRLFARPAT
jgi:uncharacterized protein